jgi:hypothetical protein
LRKMTMKKMHNKGNYAILIKYQMLRKMNNLIFTSTRMTPRLRVS